MTQDNEMDAGPSWEELMAERDALAANVERLESALEAARDAIASLDIDALGSVPETHDCPAYPIRDAVTNDLTVAINRKPATSLARLKAEWQAEALKSVRDDYCIKSQLGKSPSLYVLLDEHLDKLRRQAEDPTHD